MSGLFHRAADLKTPLQIIYIDNTNQISHRVIKVLKVQDLSFKAYCYTKKQFRTFKLESILSVATLRKRMGA